MIYVLTFALLFTAGLGVSGFVKLDSLRSVNAKLRTELQQANDRAERYQSAWVNLVALPRESEPASLQSASQSRRHVEAAPRVRGRGRRWQQ